MPAEDALFRRPLECTVPDLANFSNTAVSLKLVKQNKKLDQTVLFSIREYFSLARSIRRITFFKYIENHQNNENSSKKIDMLS